MGGEEELFKDLLYLSFFLGGLWLAGYVCKLIKISPIVGQILLGILLGPNGVDFVPLFFNDPEHVLETLNLTAPPTVSGEEPTFEASEDFLVILGQLGVTFLIFESGLHVDFPTLKVVGGPSVVVAILGTVFSIAFGMGFSAAIGFEAYPEGMAIGAVVAPTSVGIALKLLMDANVLDSMFGQTIVTAAFTDDILSLVTLAVLLELAAGELTAFSVIAPFLYCGLFIGGVFAITIFIVPRFLPQLMDKVAEKTDLQTRDIVHLGLMFFVMALFGFVGDFIGSHLLGAFLAGVVFSAVPRTHHIWEHEMELINTWLIAIFFGATVAFAVPVSALLSLDVFWKGLVIGFACIVAKLLSGIFLEKRWVVGWAMVGRGEFSFLVGQIYQDTIFADKNEPFLSEEGFAVAVWALLIAIFVAPVAFGIVLSRQLKKDEEANGKGDVNGNGRMSSVQIFSSVMFDTVALLPKQEYKLSVSCKTQPFVARDVMNILSGKNVDVLNFESESDSEQTLLTFTVLLPDPTVAQERITSANFKDEFLAFDMDKYIARLTTLLKNLFGTEAEAEITFDRKQRTVMSSARPGLMSNLFNPRASARANRASARMGEVAIPVPLEKKAKLSEGAEKLLVDETAL